jgi:transcription antitermination factor NusG
MELIHDVLPSVEVVESDELVTPTALRWWVVYTRARQEKALADDMGRAGVRYYLPLVSVRHTYEKSRVTFHKPLFPGYVFLFGHHGACDEARKTARVVSILHVQDQNKLYDELTHIHRALQSGRTVELYPSIKIGRRYRVTAGPLKDIAGVVVQQGRHHKMYVSVTMLGQSAILEVDASLLEPAD